MDPGHAARGADGRQAAPAKGQGVISLDDHPDIRRCFEGFDMEGLAIDYTVGGGANRAERRELIIYSWDRQAEPAGLF